MDNKEYNNQFENNDIFSYDNSQNTLESGTEDFDLNNFSSKTASKICSGEMYS